MNKKQRVLAAIQRKPVDRLPCSFRSSKKLVEKLQVYLDVAPTADNTLYHKVLLDNIGADFWASGSKVDKYSTFAPRYLGPPPEAPYVDDGTLFYTIGIKSENAYIAEFDMQYPHVGVEPPLAHIDSPAEIPAGFLTAKLESFDFDVMENKYRHVSAENLTESQDDIISIGTLSSIYMMICYLRGMENFFQDLAFQPKMVDHLVGEVGEFILEFNRRELDSIGEKAVYFGTWDDVAGQDGMIFSPVEFKKYFLPFYRKLIDQNKKYNLFFGWHCCGNVHGVLPMMIDAGIDVFDVVQTSAKDMDIETVHELYGNDVCLHGGLDVQKLLVEQSATEVRQAVRQIKELWGSRGGMILAPSHEALPDVPVENILAIYEELHSP